MCQDIAEKKYYDYVGAYELIKHNKMKQECFNAETLKSNAAQDEFFVTPQNYSVV